LATAFRDTFALDAGVQSARSAFKALWWTGAGAAARFASGRGRGEGGPVFRSETPPPPPGLQRSAWLEAFRKDVADVRRGLYPPSEPLFSGPSEALRAMADFLDDVRAVEARRRRGEGTEARLQSVSGAYPSYYRQNFHFQTGGWFTRDSARRYEPQVEALFSGAAGAMRRRALSLLARALRSRDQRGLRIVDLACGAGGFLADLKSAFPRAAVFGLDLSPAYSLEAAERTGASVVQANVEHLPFADVSLDAASAVYLFHELPPRLRPAVAHEIARVMRPGGVFVLADSVQPSDQPGLERLLEAFPAFFHEPFYESWSKEDVAATFAEAGLRLLETDVAFLTKAWLFERA
jgi:ubiquinone/menaquinone biosynthesis C-methylase UbiE